MRLYGISINVLDYDFIRESLFLQQTEFKDSILFVGINPAYDYRDDELMLLSTDKETLMYGSFYQRDDAPEYFKT